jgi:nucleoside-diphosphate-sugar epimerase
MYSIPGIYGSVAGRVTGARAISSRSRPHEKGVVMKVFVAGATGAIGRQLVPRLVAGGHAVTGMTRTHAKCDLLRGLGARPVVADALDAEAVKRAVADAEPDVVVHELTAIPPVLDMRHIEREFALTNQLRTEGTDHLVSAAQAVGVRRFVAQSHAALPYARVGGPVKAEGDPLDDDPAPQMRASLAALRHLEATVLGIDGADPLVLRYGWLYGPGTSIALHPLGSQVELLRKRQFPVVGRGTGIWSFVHVGDAAAATALAVEDGAAGVYNVVDDEPAPVSEFLPVLAAAVDAKPPRRVPRWLGRLAAGEWAVLAMTEIRGASNDKAKRALGWQLRFPSWRQGFVEGLG